MSKVSLGVAICGIGSFVLGCGSSAVQQQHLVAELELARQDAAAMEARVSELEAQLSRVLLAPPAAQSVSQRELARVVEKLDVVIAQNQELILHSQVAALESRVGEALAQPALQSCEGVDTSDAEAQLRFWAARLRSDAGRFRGGLSPEQNDALNVLLRGRRKLDPGNPWEL